MIGLAFAILSLENVKLKKVGFQVILTLVRHFSQSFEQIGDEDEEDEDQARKMREKGFNEELIS